MSVEAKKQALSCCLKVGFIVCINDILLLKRGLTSAGKTMQCKAILDTFRNSNTVAHYHVHLEYNCF